MTTLTLTPHQRAERVASRQHGALDHAQAQAAGLTDGQIHRLVAAGRWRRPVLGTYVIAGAPDTPAQRAMVAYLATRRTGGVLSHQSAAALWGLLPPSPLPHVTVPPSASVRCRGAKVHRSRVDPAERAGRDGVVLTSVSRTLADLATTGDAPSLTELVDDAFCRRLATATSVATVLDRFGRGRRGVTLLRAVIEVWTPEIEPGSPAEVRLLRSAEAEGIVGLVAQHEVRDVAGGFVARLDLALPAQRCGFEYDGVRHHGPRQWGRDEARYARLHALGWRIEPISKLDLLPGERRLRDVAVRWGLAAA